MATIRVKPGHWTSGGRKKITGPLDGSPTPSLDAGTRAAFASTREDNLTGLGRGNGHGPLGQARQARQAPLQQLPLGVTPAHAAAVRGTHAIDLRVSPGIGHVG